MTKRSMNGTARCDECDAKATHERGPGSPLSIKHRQWCSEARWTVKLADPIARMLQQTLLYRRYEPSVRILSFIEDATWERVNGLRFVTVGRIQDELGIPETTARRNLRWLLDGGFIKKVPCEVGPARDAFQAVRKGS